MPDFPVIAPLREPDLGKFLGISLDGIRTYAELMDRIRSKRTDFEEHRYPTSEAGVHLRRLQIPRENIATLCTLYFGMTRDREGVINYEISLDKDNNILGIENAYGYRGPHAKQLLLHFAALATPVVAVGLLIALAFNFFLSAK